MRTPPSFHCWAAVLLLAATAPAQDWFPRSTRSVPGFRGTEVMAWDPVRGTTLLLGIHGLLTSATWEWTGEDWADVTPSPPAANPVRRDWAAMATQSGRGRVLLFGGWDSSLQPLSDTWEWTGASWALLQPAVSPPARLHHAMAEGPGGRMVLFGGVVGAFPQLTHADDTWEWDGASWTGRAPAVSPPARGGHAMARSPRGTVLLFGGVTGATGATLLGDTWEWDGADWRQLFPTPSPSPRRDPRMVFDEARRRTVLFHAGARDTWEWDGTAWLLISPARSPPVPPPQSGPATGPMAYDVRRHAAVLLAAEDLAGQTVGRTWEYGFPSFYETLGQGCPGSAGRPMLARSLLPRLGSPFSVLLARLPPARPGILLLGTSRTRLGVLPLPLDLGPAGMPGCLLYTSAEAVFPIATSGLEGVVVWSAGVPSDRSLLNLLFYNQAFFADPGTNPAAMTATNAGQGAIGL